MSTRESPARYFFYKGHMGTSDDGEYVLFSAYAQRLAEWKDYGAVMRGAGLVLAERVKELEAKLATKGSEYGTASNFSTNQGPQSL